MARFDFSQLYDEHDIYPAGQVIFEAGDPGDSMYILLEGEIKITLHGHVIDELHSGTVFGEMALVDAQPRSAGATAVTDCKMIKIDEARFGELASKRPQFGIEVMRIMSERTRRLIAEEVHKQRLERELAIGREIQLGLLPMETPTFDGWEFAAYYEAATQVGGDLYDFIFDPADPNIVQTVVADVTGKGVPAALFMASMRSIMRTLTRQQHSPTDILRLSNQSIVQDIRSPLFLSSVFTRLDTSTGEMILSNAGHEWPLWLKAASGTVEPISIPGVLLGAFREIIPQERSITLEPGDMLVFYTDGVTEARNAVGDFYGDERFAQVLLDNAAATAEEMVTLILDHVHTFTEGNPQSDDLTLIVIKRQAA